MRILVGFVLCIFVINTNADPVVHDSSYNIELLTTVQDTAINALAIGSDGALYATGYNTGNILRIESPAGPAPQAAIEFAAGMPFATGITTISSGRMFVTSSTGPDSTVYEVLPDGTVFSFSTGYSYPTSITSIGNNLYVSNSGDGTIDFLENDTGISAVIISGLNSPFGLSTNGTDTLYFADHATGEVFSSDLNGNLTLIATLSPLGVVYTGMNTVGELFISDVNTAEIYKIDSNGVMSLFASGFVGKNPPINGPHDYAFDSLGNMYVSDGSSIWRISPIIIDTDGDGISDDIDNCTLIPNPTQCDGNSDGYGNRCDADFNNDGIVDRLDVGPLVVTLGTANPVTDLTCDGIVNRRDVLLFRYLFGSPPGPSYIDSTQEDEPNNTWQTATVLPQDTSIIGTQSDDDWFVIDATVGNRILIDLTFTHADGDIDVAFYDDAGNIDPQFPGILRANSVTNNSDHEFVENDISVVGPGTYYIRVYGGAAGNQGNSYTLTWSELAGADDGFEENDSNAAAAALAESTVAFGSQSDEDWYSIDAAADGTRVLVSLRFNAADDLDLELRDAGGTLLASSMNGVGVNEAIDFTVPTIGTYHLRVTGDNSGDGYAIDWEGN